MMMRSFISSYYIILCLLLLVGCCLVVHQWITPMGTLLSLLEKLKLSNVDGGPGKKLADLNANATKSNTSDGEICRKIIDELFSACNPDDSACFNPNGQSFAVSTEQVCAAVNTPTNLFFEVIGNESDGFVDKCTFCELYLSLFCAI